MPNVSRINGFRPVRYLNGSPWTGAATRYKTQASDATAIFMGDAVKLDGGSDGNGVRTVTQATAGAAVVGVVVGMVVEPTQINSPQYRLASTARTLMVVDDPNVLFEVQEDAVGGALASNSVGLNASLIVGSGSTTTGQSGMQLDTSTAATTATLELKIIEFSQREDNEVASANAKVIVKINNHQLAASTGTAGV